MNRPLLTAARRLTLLGLGALSLAACDDAHKVAANPKICLSFQKADAAATKAPAIAPPIEDGSGALDECAKRWAYSLAPSRDSAEMVATAVVGACNAQLTRWNRDALSSPEGDAQAASLTTGELTSPITEHNRFAHTRALLYVVQARAGACAPPPASNGVPEGIG